MSGKVFANGLEIACKVSKGKAVAAFPDPCWSPPSPSVGPIVIPYANTAQAKDLSKGTKSVLIKNKPVYRKDKSFIKTSTGNEAATKTFGQGFISKTIKGEAYFTGWSMNVMVEGYNVPRHTDLTTNNHGCDPGNDAPWIFVSTLTDPKGHCDASIGKVKDKCSVSEEENNEFHNDQHKQNKIRQSQGKGKKKVRDLTWKDKHCKQLAVKPGIQSLESAGKKLTEKLKEVLGDFSHVASSPGFNSVTSSAAGGVVSNKLGAIYNVVDNTYSLIFSAYNALGKANMVQEIENKAKEIQNYLDEVTKVNDAIDAGKDSLEYQDLVDGLSERANDMTDAANNDPCLKARKCMLVPYNEKRQDSKKVNRGKIEKGDLFGELYGDVRGCCPGQTGHHLIPDSWAANGGCSKDSGYHEDDAPVVCAEGVSHSLGGSHQLLHKRLDALVNDFKVKRPGQKLKMEDAIEMAAQSHQETVGERAGEGPEDKCNKECTKAQLKHYYNKLGCEGEFEATTMTAGDNKQNNKQEGGK